jgi:hypothetical protein
MFTLLRRTQRYETNATETEQNEVKTNKLLLFLFSGKIVIRGIFYLGHVRNPSMADCCCVHPEARAGVQGLRQVSGAAARGRGDPHAEPGQGLARHPR